MGSLNKVYSNPSSGHVSSRSAATRTVEIEEPQQEEEEQQQEEQEGQKEEEEQQENFSLFIRGGQNEQPGWTEGQWAEPISAALPANDGSRCHPTTGLRRLLVSPHGGHVIYDSDDT